MIAGGYLRRNHWVPMAKARDMDDLNVQLLAVSAVGQAERHAPGMGTNTCVRLSAGRSLAATARVPARRQGALNQ